MNKSTKHLDHHSCFLCFMIMMLMLFTVSFSLNDAALAAPANYDFDNSGFIDNGDISILASMYGTVNTDHDTNSDGIIDIFDLVKVGKLFGSSVIPNIDINVGYRPTAEGYQFYFEETDVSSYTSSSTLYGQLLYYNEASSSYDDYWSPQTPIEFVLDDNNQYQANLNEIIPLDNYKLKLYENNNLIDDYVIDGAFSMYPLVHVEKPFLHGAATTREIEIAGYISNYDASGTNTLSLELNGTEVNGAVTIAADGSYTDTVTLGDGDNNFQVTLDYNYDGINSMTSTWGQVEYITSSFTATYHPTITGYEFFIDEDDIISDTTATTLYGSLMKYESDRETYDNFTCGASYLEFTKEDAGDGTFQFKASLNEIIPLGNYIIRLYENSNLADDHVADGIFTMLPLVHVETPYLSSVSATEEITITGYISNYDSTQTNHLSLKVNETIQNNAVVIDADGNYSTSATLSEGDNRFYLILDYDYDTVSGSTTTWGEIEYTVSP